MRVEVPVDFVLCDTQIGTAMSEKLKLNLVKLATNGSNWVMYRDRLLSLGYDAKQTGIIRPPDHNAFPKFATVRPRGQGEMIGAQSSTDNVPNPFHLDSQHIGCKTTLQWQSMCESFS
jgi:hypothetical protein